jgi:hypothetical protein
MANKAKILPLAIAEYELAVPAFSASTIITRQLFLKSIAQHAPLILSDLVTRLLDTHEQVTGLVMEPGGHKTPHTPREWYQALSDWRYLHHVVKHGEVDIESRRVNRRVPRWRIDDLQEAFGYFNELHQGLDAWASRWNLEVYDTVGFDEHFGTSIFKGAALFALFFRSVLGEDIKHGWLEAATIPDGLPQEYPHVPHKPFIFSFRPGWSPTSQKRADVAKEMRDAFERQLTQYLDDQEEQARTHPLFEQAPRNVNEEHIKWLVYYQVHAWSYQRIATNLAYRERKTVEQAVKSLADRAEIILRPPGKGGRPKTSSSPTS